LWVVIDLDASPGEGGARDKNSRLWHQPFISTAPGLGVLLVNGYGTVWRQRSAYIPNPVKTIFANGNSTDRARVFPYNPFIVESFLSHRTADFF
jgi:hypothetical protein